MTSALQHLRQQRSPATLPPSAGQIKNNNQQQCDASRNLLKNTTATAPAKPSQKKKSLRCLVSKKAHSCYCPHGRVSKKNVLLPLPNKQKHSYHHNDQPLPRQRDA
mmetsp:Transcript_21857/g.39369  ORF Transcript_21857/g.39369 Transcript_21857/m.39369 type:complete len:106 (-) Transcript_21857:58-375(-)